MMHGHRNRQGKHGCPSPAARPLFGRLAKQTRLDRQPHSAFALARFCSGASTVASQRFPHTAGHAPGKPRHVSSWHRPISYDPQPLGAATTSSCATLRSLTTRGKFLTSARRSAGFWHIRRICTGSQHRTTSTSMASRLALSKPDDAFTLAGPALGRLRDCRRSCPSRVSASQRTWRQWFVFLAIGPWAPLRRE
jgi:hypothetical protein